MDTQSLELWGNMFLNAAQGQKIMEDVSQMVEDRMGSVRDIFDLYGRWWGMDRLLWEEAPQFFATALKTAEDFQKTVTQGFFSLMSFPMGCTPSSDYQSLMQDFEALREKAERQDEDIHRIQAILEEKLSAQGEGITSFQNLMKKQTQQFQDMMVGFSKIFSEAGGSQEEQKTEEQAPKRASRTRRKT